MGTMAGGNGQTKEFLDLLKYSRGLGACYKERGPVQISFTFSPLGLRHTHTPVVVLHFKPLTVLRIRLIRPSRIATLTMRSFIALLSLPALALADNHFSRSRSHGTRHIKVRANSYQLKDMYQGEDFLDES
jgi:hypothetical protein